MNKLDIYSMKKIKREYGSEIYKIKSDSFNYIIFTPKFMFLILYIRENKIRSSNNYFFKHRKEINKLRKYKSNYYQIKEIWLKPKGKQLIIQQI